MHDGMIEKTNRWSGFRACVRTGPELVGVLLLLSVLTVPWVQAVMSNQERQVATAAELTAAAADAVVGDIVVAANLSGLPTFRLSPGKTLRGRARM
jgi:hypothetical protein